MENKKAILGFHDRMYAFTYVVPLDEAGYKIHLAGDKEEMESLMEENPNAEVYLMDINLDYPNTDFVEPAIEIYKNLEGRLKKHECKFYALSGNNDAVENAIKSGIPKKNIFGKLDSGKILKQILE